jgi:phage shock protein A
MVPAMAQTQKDFLSRIADAGEEALSRVAGSQKTAKVVETMGGMRERLDDVQKRIRGLDELEKRVAKLEKQLAELGKPKATRPRSTTAKKTTAGKKPTGSTTRKKPAS